MISKIKGKWIHSDEEDGVGEIVSTAHEFDMENFGKYFLYYFF